MLDLIEEKLASLVQAEDQLTCAMRYSLMNKGKRLRPLFALHVIEALCPVRLDDALNLAAAIECIHTYSLIHDDLPCMDDDDFRRGRPSLHKAFGEDIALLAGDALLTLGFELIANIHHNTIVKRFAQLIGKEGMVGGQMLDISITKETLSKELIFKLYELKTANLFIAAVELSGMIACDDRFIIERLSGYGKWYGIAFQIADDIEDYLAGKQEPILTEVGIQTLTDWYEEAKMKANSFDIGIPFLQTAFELLDKKVFV
ncbi:MAG: polyprenyl synthetase family protein [Chlamydiae bacterium]|nr:polyprenyl synthetase family protein [Chlamydiota bacterium]